MPRPMKSPSGAAAPDVSADAFLARLRSPPWAVFPFGAASAAEQMLIDTAMWRAASREQVRAALRFYTWTPPAVSLGRFQDESGVDLEYARSRGWGIVRRPTGGRGVLHQHELTYALALSPSLVGGLGVRRSYRVLSRLVEAGVRSLLTGRAIPRGNAASHPEGAVRGEPNCFALAQECDTLLGGGKLIGSAQLRRNGALLQHGSILLDAEPEAWQALFGSRGSMVTLRDLTGSLLEPVCVASAIERALTAEGIRLVPAHPLPRP
jgi:lipoate-protein ligase A